MADRLGLEPVSHCGLSLPAVYGKTTTEITDTGRAYTQHQTPYQEDNITTLLPGARAPTDMLSNGSGVRHCKRMLTNIILKQKYSRQEIICI